MARWRDCGEPEPEIPAWIRHESDGGFVPADWWRPGDEGLPPQWREHAARGRWVAVRCRWLDEHPDVADILLQQLRDRVAARRDFSSQ